MYDDMSRKNKWDEFFCVMERHYFFEEDDPKYIYFKVKMCHGEYEDVTKEEFAVFKRAISSSSNNADRYGDYETGKLIRRIMYASETLGLWEYSYLCDKYGACYIATAVYGSYDAPEVCTLRIFRDKYLAKRGWGQYIINFYYRYSPKLANKIRCDNKLNLIFRFLLNMFVRKLSSKYKNK